MNCQTVFFGYFLWVLWVKKYHERKQERLFDSNKNGIMISAENDSVETRKALILWTVMTTMHTQFFSCITI